MENLEKTNESISSESKADSPETAPSFEEHMANNPQMVLQRYLETSGLREIRRSETRFDELLQELSPSETYSFLSRVNGILRGVDENEWGRRSGVQVADHSAPSKRVQGVILSEAVDALKSINDNKYRAALGYYLVNGLHLFPDGNGRTSRAVYEVFENPNFNLASDDSLAYHTQNQAYGHGKFEKEKNIRSSEEALILALDFLKFDLVREGKINSIILKKRVSLEKGVYDSVPDIYFTEDAEKNLTDQEKRRVKQAFLNEDIASTALLAALTRKGSFDRVMSACTQNNGIDNEVRLEVLKQDLDTGKVNKLAGEVFDGWTAQDYKAFVNTTEIIQKFQFDKLIDFFKMPEKYKSRDGVRIADYLSGKVDNSYSED